MNASPRWSPQQSAALDQVGAWHKAAASRRGDQVLRVFGYAGTGKTTLARHFAGQIDGPTCYAAFTGKAALMMQRNGCQDASTIHSLIYEVREDADGVTRFILNRESPAKDAALIVIDECSMVDQELARDLLSFRRPILVLGDPAQLPPVSGAGYFTEALPNVMLTEIHRQAAENPIIRMATDVREGRPLRLGDYGSSAVVGAGVLTRREVSGADQVLVGKNATRRAYNQKLRALGGFTDALPEIGERLVCLRNDKPKGIFNGGLFKVTGRPAGKAKRGCVKLEVASDDFPGRPPVEVQVRREFFLGGAENLTPSELRETQQFDFGYALTVHKAQGSQWGQVVLYDESGTFREEAKRWLYTGLTRASESVLVVRGAD